MPKKGTMLDGSDWGTLWNLADEPVTGEGDDQGKEKDGNGTMEGSTKELEGVEGMGEEKGCISEHRRPPEE